MTTGTLAPEQFEAPQTPATDGHSSLGRVGGLTVRARLIVLGATLSVLLAVVAVVAITGVSSIKSAYNADQIPSSQPRSCDSGLRGLAAGRRPEQHVRGVGGAARLVAGEPDGSDLEAGLAGPGAGQRAISRRCSRMPLSPQARALTDQLVKDLRVYNGWTNQMYSAVAEPVRHRHHAPRSTTSPTARCATSPSTTPRSRTRSRATSTRCATQLRNEEPRDLGTDPVDGRTAR